MSSIAIILSVVLALGSLHIFFRAVEFKWPASYFTVTRSLEREVAAAPARYALFRFGPVFVVASALAVLLARDAGPVVVPTLLLGVLHALLTSGRAIVKTSSRLRRSRPMVLGLHGAVSIACILAAGGGVVAAPHLRGVVPSTNDLTGSFWTAAITALLGAFILRLVQGTRQDPYGDPAGPVRRQLGDLWDQAEILSTEHDADLNLVRAVMLVEAQQRPPWVRRLERLLGRLMGRGTYGPLQVSSPVPLSDHEAFVKGIATRFRGQKVPILKADGGETIDTGWLRAFLLVYNPSAEWRSQVESMYFRLTTPNIGVISGSANYANDYRPQIEVTEYQQRGRLVSIGGTATVYEDTLILRQRSATGAMIGEPRLVSAVGEDPRKTWQAEVEAEADAVLLEIDMESAEEGAPDAGPLKLPILSQ